MRRELFQVRDNPLTRSHLGTFDPGTEELLYEQRDGIATLTFNRPSAYNAMTWAMYEGLYAACEHADDDERIRVLVLRGAGEKAFVAGPTSPSSDRCLHRTIS